MNCLQSFERWIIGALLAVAVLTFFFPLLSIQLPVVGNQSVSGYDCVSRTQSLHERLSSVPNAMLRSESNTGEESPSTPADHDQPPLPLSVRLSTLLPVEIFTAFASAIVAFVCCISRTRRSPLKAASILGSAAALAALIHVTLINSDLHAWLDQIISAAGGARNPFSGLARGIGTLLAGSIQIRPGTGLYVQAIALAIVTILVCSRIFEKSQPVQVPSPESSSSSVAAKTTSFWPSVWVLGIIVAAVGIMAVLTKQTSNEIKDTAGLFQFARSCPGNGQWEVDFSGSGEKYRLEKHHCSTSQLAGLHLASGVKIDPDPNDVYPETASGYDFLLVIRPRMVLPDVILYGGYQAGAYSHVEPVTIQSQHGQVVVVDGQLHGSGGFVDWCLLAADKKGKISCWTEQSDYSDKYIEKSLEAGELVGAWHLEAKDGHLFIQSSVFASADPLCCPTQGTMRVALVLNNDALSWGQITRSNTRGDLLKGVAAFLTAKAAQLGSPITYTACQTDPPEQATLCVMDTHAPDDGYLKSSHDNTEMSNLLYRTGFRRIIVENGTNRWEAPIN